MPEEINIVHEFDDEANHRLIVNGKEGGWFSYVHIADGPPGFEFVHGTTDYYLNKLPAVFVIEHETKAEERDVPGVQHGPNMSRDGDD